MPDNLAFYADPATGDKYVRAPIVGPARYWAIGLIPRSEMVVRGVNYGQSGQTPRPPDKTWLAVSSAEGMISFGAGPEVRLLNKLNDFSLNRYKDYIFDFPEDARAVPFTLPNTPIEEMTFLQYSNAYKRNFAFLAQVGWDYSADLGPNHWGWVTGPESVNYAHNASRWSPQDRVTVRSWLIFAAYTLELDTAMPQWSMLGGHPNFAAALKQILGVAPGLFPKHPDAPRWRSTYLSFFNEYLDRFVRKPDDATGAKAGRFTESIACYNYASMESIGMAATGLKMFDGTQLLDRPEVRAWARWDMESRLPFRLEGARIVPPQGAHAAVTVLSPNGGRWYGVSLAFINLLKDSAPQLADEYLWTLTNGGQGTRPASVQSSLFVDYGPVMRYGFGTPDEAYLQIPAAQRPRLSLVRNLERRALLRRQRQGLELEPARGQRRRIRHQQTPRAAGRQRRARRRPRHRRPLRLRLRPVL